MTSLDCAAYLNPFAWRHADSPALVSHSGHSSLSCFRAHDCEATAGLNLNCWSFTTCLGKRPTPKITKTHEQYVTRCLPRPGPQFFRKVPSKPAYLRLQLENHVLGRCAQKRTGTFWMPRFSSCWPVIDPNVKNTPDALWVPLFPWACGGRAASAWVRHISLPSEAIQSTFDLPSWAAHSVGLQDWRSVRLSGLCMAFPYAFSIKAWSMVI